MDNRAKMSGVMDKAKSERDANTIRHDSNFNTVLSPKDESDFKGWKAKNAPNDSGEDYDLRGAFKEGLKRDTKSQHWDDKFKKPNHPTFSDQSQYAKEAPGKAGHWNGDKFIPPKRK